LKINDNSIFKIAADIYFETIFLTKTILILYGKSDILKAIDITRYIM